MPIRLSVLPFLLLLAACENYDYTLNDRVVYRGRGLLSDYTIVDAGLRDCVAQAIADAGIRQVDELRQLNCSHAGIESLEGLAAFTALTRLKLSDNRIRNLMELASLTRLQALYLDNNAVIDPVPLYRLPDLRLLDLAGNTRLQCPEPGALAQLETLTLPEHCTAGPGP